MGLLPPPGSTNEKGEPLDVLKNIQAKKEIGAQLLPLFWSMVKEAEAMGYVEADHPELIKTKKKLKEASEMLNIKLED